MPLVNTKEMFQKAYDGGYAIGAFNVNNMEIVQGIIAACKELNSPVILQVSGSARKYAHHGYLYNMVRILAGTLCEVGAGRMQPEAIPGILASRDRHKAGPTLPAKGLFLKSVEYD